MPNSNIENITAVIDYVENHLTEKLDLDRIAEAVHYSKYHLHRMFADTVGLTVHDYIQRRRLTEAAKLLVFSDKPILEIALTAGFESQQAFSACFTSMYKTAPGRYRETERFYPPSAEISFRRELCNAGTKPKAAVGYCFCRTGGHPLLDGAGTACCRWLSLPG